MTYDFFLKLFLNHHPVLFNHHLNKSLAAILFDVIDRCRTIRPKNNFKNGRNKIAVLLNFNLNFSNTVLRFFEIANHVDFPADTGERN
jgi:hypothetical protein